MIANFRVARLGTAAIAWTAGFFVAILFFLGRVVYASTSGAPFSTFDVGAAIVLALMVVYGWLRSVRRYSVTDDGLVVERAGPGKVTIPSEKIASVEANSDLGSFFNLGFFSIGGLFGWAGKVRVRKPTDIQSLDALAYGTNPRYAVVLHLNSEKTIIVTPADPAGLVNALSQRVGSSTKAMTAGRKKKRG
ncbi:MAG: hypothetical protein IVW55_06460 [Chloroflexi bacterium]|nr:hypothetical protein [Chloroflexota bacterium]